MRRRLHLLHAYGHGLGQWQRLPLENQRIGQRIAETVVLDHGHIRIGTKRGNFLVGQRKRHDRRFVHVDVEAHFFRREARGHAAGLGRELATSKISTRDEIASFTI